MGRFDSFDIEDSFPLDKPEVAASAEASSADEQDAALADITISGLLKEVMGRPGTNQSTEAKNE